MTKDTTIAKPLRIVSSTFIDILSSANNLHQQLTYCVFTSTQPPTPAEYKYSYGLPILYIHELAED